MCDNEVILIYSICSYLIHNGCWSVFFPNPFFLIHDVISHTKEEVPLQYVSLILHKTLINE